MTNKWNVPSTTSGSFADFLGTRTNRRFISGAIALALLQFIVFKIFYPYPDFISDSYSYIFGADKNLSINIWPIGYSKFLMVLHTLTHSDTLCTAVQYLLLFLSCMYFYASITFLYKPSKLSKVILFIFLFLNPVFLYLANLINSDCVFAAMSVLWLTELIWTINKRSTGHIVVQGLLVFLCFTIRNNAYFYPIVSVWIFLLLDCTIWKKIAGIGIPILLIIPFVLYTRQQAYKISGEKQFSLFSGWQLCNNALYGYRSIKIDTNKLPNAECREFDRLVKKFYREAPPDIDQTIAQTTGNYFIVSQSSPMKKFMDQHYELTDDYSMVVAWAKASVIYEQYGQYLLRKSPLGYIKHFVLLNCKNYLLPPLSNFEVYNRNQLQTWTIVQDFFDYQTPTLGAASKTAQGNLLFAFKPIFLFLNMYTLGAGIWLFVKRRRAAPLPQKIRLLLALLTIYLLLNLSFSIVAAMNILRYQIVPMIILLSLAVLLSELLEPSNKAEIAIQRLPAESTQDIAIQI